MSIVVSVKVGEGLVLAADSVTTVQVLEPKSGTVNVLNTYEYARKVSQVGGLPIGTLTWGIELIGNRNIESLLSEYDNLQLGPRYDKSTGEYKPWKVKEIVDEIFRFMRPQYDEAYGSLPEPQKPILGLLVAGYSHGEFFPEEFRFEFPGHTAAERVRPNKDGRPVYGASWYGQTEAIVRLYKGYDPRLRQVLAEKGVDKKIIDELPRDLAPLEWKVIFDGMPLQEAIDLAEYLINVVIGSYRFPLGPPTCGGHIDIAVMTHKGFDWVRRKKWR